MNQHRKPCAECPFTRDGKTGGASGTTYIGQAFGPFFLPCHMDPGYDIDRRSHKLAQCCGAAIFRARVDIAPMIPSFLLHLPLAADVDDRVFKSPAELLSHYEKCPLDLAEEFLKTFPPELLCHLELRKSGCHVTLVPRGEPHDRP
jgi:hypothetical protein